MLGVEKFLVYVVTAVVGSTAITAILAGGLNNTVVWVDLVITAATAALTWLKANTPTQPWAKQAIALFGAGVLAFVSAWTDHQITLTEIPAIVLAILGALQVGVVANTVTVPRPAP
jgi:hypothetical protein